MQELRRIATCIVIVLLIGCGKQVQSMQTLAQSEFATLVEEGECQILDVRTTDEYAKGHLKKSINIDFKLPNFAERCAAILEKRKVVAIYCRSGKRSNAAGRILSDMGYDVREMGGGILEWKGKVVYGVE